MSYIVNDELSIEFDYSIVQDLNSDWSIIVKRDALINIINTVGKLPAETGGIILSQDGCVITDFIFDKTGSTTTSSYTPNVDFFNEERPKWNAKNKDWWGMAHSHPGTLGRLSAGDMRYIKNLFSARKDLHCMFFPLLTPATRTLYPFVVFRDDPEGYELADLLVVD